MFCGTVFEYVIDNIYKYCSWCAIFPVSLLDEFIFINNMNIIKTNKILFPK